MIKPRGLLMKSLSVSLIIGGLLFPGFIFCQSSGSFPLSPQATKILVDSLANQISRYYVIKETSEKMCAQLKKGFKEGRYNQVNDPHILAGRLTSDVLSVCRDEHFHVEYNPALANETAGNIEDVPKMVAEKLNQEKAKNFGFKKAEILHGNIAYLEITSFSRLNKYSKETADAALKMLSNANALIIDLRYGVGGSPEMVNHLVSHFFKDKIHAADIYIRSENATVTYWTVPDSSYDRLTTIPVYILTSYKTFSAAEGLTYQLQALKRATVVGEVTRGGAHTVTYRPLSSGFVTDIPFGRAVDPVTKKNWEGVGIIPDIQVKADVALETAELKIFEKAFSASKDSSQVKALKWQLELLQSANHPVHLDSVSMVQLTGDYGPYQVSYKNGTLYYKKEGKAKFPLIPMSVAKMRPKGNDTFVLEFIKVEKGRAGRIATYYEDGRIEYANRNE